MKHLHSPIMYFNPICGITQRLLSLVKKNAKKGTIKLYVNGALVQQGNCASVPSSVAKVTGRLGATIPISNNTSYQYQSWQLSNLYVLDDVLTDKESLLLYTLGPNYAGGFEVDLAKFRTNEMVCEKYLRLVHDQTSVLTDPSQHSLSHLHDKLVFVFCSRNLVVAQSLRLPFFPGGMPANSPPVTKTLVASSAKMYGYNSISQFSSHIVPTVSKQMSVKELIYNAGGVSIVLYLISLAQHQREYQRSSMRLLQRVLEYHNGNTLEMNNLCGYQLLSFLMRRKHWVLDEPMLSIVFGLTGIKKASRGSSYSRGVISNVNALKHLLLQHKIWQRAPLHIQKLLYQSLADLVTAHEFANFNSKRYIEAGVLDHLFTMFKNFVIPEEIGNYLIAIVKAIISDNPKLYDLKSLVNYLITTHPTPQIVSHTASVDVLQSHTPNKNVRRVISWEGSISHNTSFDIISVSPSNNQFLPPSPSSSYQHLPINSTPTQKKLHMRCLVLKMLIDILTHAKESLLSQFCETCSLEILFAILRIDSLATHILLLKLLEILLRNPSVKIQFETMRGFQVLGEQELELFNVNEELFSVLFTILLGSAPPPSTEPMTLFDDSATNTYHSFTAYFLSHITDEITLMHPGAITPIILLVGHDSIDTFLQHSVIKLLLDLFLRNDHIKQQFLERSIIRLLCDLISREFTKKMNVLDRSNTEKVWRTEEDIMSFLKAIALFGCMSSMGTQLVDEIIMSIDVCRDLPISYRFALQRRILYDVLLFFRDNNFTRNTLLVNTFSQACALASHHLCWYEETVQQEERNDWARVLSVPEPSQFIKLLIDLFSQTKNNVTNPGIQSKILNNFIFLIEYLLNNSQFADQTSITVLLNGLINNNLISYFLTNEEFLTILIVYTHPLLNIPSLLPIVIKLWSVIFNAKYVLKDTVFINCNIDFNSLSVDEESAPPTIHIQSHILSQVKRTEEKQNTSQRDWLQDRLTNRDKHSISTQRNNERLKSNSVLITTTLLSFQQQQTKIQVEWMQKHIEEDKLVRDQWKILSQRVTTERSIWPIDTGRWKLDPTEGTNRMRIRLKRSAANIPFLSPTFTKPPPSQLDANGYLPLDVIAGEDANGNTPLAPSESSTEALNLVDPNQDNVDEENLQDSTQTIIKPGERILNYYKAARINPSHKRDGEIVIGEFNAYFIDDKHQPVKKNKLSSLNGKHLVWSYQDIREIHKRRYLLKSNALEIFLLNGKTYLLALDTELERDTVYSQIISFDLPNRVDYEYEVSGGMLKKSITKKWSSGLISNFEYLMHLNTLAGRSFNDLTQYPIFPFIVADYTNNELDTTNNSSYRDLTKPMGAQETTRLNKFLDRYNQLVEMGEQPFHYGSHYSNLGSVLHFLVRLEPFTQYFIEFQGGRFDVPDRAFHSLKQTWLLSSAISSSDVKELIPEFFFLAEFLDNRNKFDMGVKQDGQRVDKVVLPPWSQNSARLFIKKHKEALESKYVSEHLHAWIDLLFGYKQQGEEAINSFNVFHPLTYEKAIDIDTVTDPVIKAAHIAQISSYGQTPKQLFKRPHPEKDFTTQLNMLHETVYAHPDRLSAFPMWSTNFSVGYLTLLDDTPIALGPNKVLIYPKAEYYVSWGHWDQTLRICSLDTSKVISVVETYHQEDIICGEIPKNGTVLVTGGTACVVKVWRRSRAKNRTDILYHVANLYGHSQPIQCIAVSQEWSIIVSGSIDHTCIVWDLNRMCYVRSLSNHNGPVVAVAVSPTNGDIVTVSESPNKNYVLTLYSINGEQYAQATSSEKVNCIKFTGGIEGTFTNIIVGGLTSGSLKVWSAWDLTLLKQLDGGHKSMVTAIAFSNDYTQLISGDENGLVVCWSVRKPRETFVGPMGV